MFLSRIQWRKFRRAPVQWLPAFAARVRRLPNGRNPSLGEGELAAVIANCWTRKTSDDPARWSDENAAWGQCAVTALVVQDLLGGELLCGSVNYVPHFWNILPDQRELDLTRHQFREILVSGSTGKCSRRFVLSFRMTRRRYRRLRKDVLSALHRRERLLRQNKFSKAGGFLNTLRLQQ